MGFKRTPEGRVFFQGVNTANDEAAPRPGSRSQNPPPQMRSPLTGEKTQGQIITLLKTLNERLKATQADRDRMMGELDKYRTTIEGLEEKSVRNERLALDLEHKIDVQGKKAPAGDPKSAEAERLAKKTIRELEATRRALAEMERNQNVRNKAITEKVSKTASGFNAMRKRLEATEAKQNVIDERVEDSLNQQAKLIRKVDKTIEDRARFMRKIERIEETVIQTRDSLNAKAMVLLTEQGATAIDPDISQGLAEHIPADFDAEIEEAAREATRIANIKTPQRDRDVSRRTAVAAIWWKNPAVYSAASGIAAFVLAVLLIGMLALNNWQLPRFGGSTAEIPVQTYRQSAIQEPEPFRELPPIRNTQPIENLAWHVEAAPVPVSELAPERPINDDIGAVDLENEEQVAALIESNPQKIAEELNKIEPQKQTPAIEKVIEAAAPAPVAAPKAPTIDPNAGKQPNPTQAKSLAGQISPDRALPNVIQTIEGQAFRGIGEAQHDLAAIYTAGHGGVAQNYQRAAFWFEQAAENGIANAAYNLGVLHHQGLGFAPDVDKALRWYKDAASKGHPEAQYNLGIAYIEGIGVPYDPIAASKYFENAANNGVMEAAYNLGLIYENGLLGNAKPDSALLWYKTAADQGSPEAKQALQDLARALGIDLKDVNRIADSMRASEAVKSVQPKAAAPVAKPAAPKSVAQEKESSLKPLVNEADSTDFGAYATGQEQQAIVAQIQEFLMREGLYPGPADGVSGALTEDAIRSYESLSNLSSTGIPSQNLLGHMLANVSKSALYEEAAGITARTSMNQ